MLTMQPFSYQGWTTLKSISVFTWCWCCLVGGRRVLMPGCKYLSSIYPSIPSKQHLLGLCLFQLNAGDKNEQEMVAAISVVNRKYSGRQEPSIDDTQRREQIWTISNRIPLYKPGTGLFFIEICPPDSSTSLVSWNCIVFLKYCPHFARSTQTCNSKSSQIIFFLEASCMSVLSANFVALVRYGGNFPRFVWLHTLSTY